MYIYIYIYFVIFIDIYSYIHIIFTRIFICVRKRLILLDRFRNRLALRNRFLLVETTLPLAPRDQYDGLPHTRQRRLRNQRRLRIQRQVHNQ